MIPTAGWCFMWYDFSACCKKTEPVKADDTLLFINAMIQNIAKCTFLDIFLFWIKKIDNGQDSYN